MTACADVPVRDEVQSHEGPVSRAHAGGQHGGVGGVVGHPLVLRVAEAVDDLRVGVQAAELAVEAVADAAREMHHHVAVHLSRQPGETGEEGGDHMINYSCAHSDAPQHPTQLSSKANRRFQRSKTTRQDGVHRETGNDINCG